MLLTRFIRRTLLCALITLPAACVANTTGVSRLDNDLPVTRWDHRPEAAKWTAATLTALESHGDGLLNVTPSDIGRFCPGYAKGDEDERAAFWAGFLSALAKYESTWNPRASGGGGRWLGLLQIDPRTARGYGCQAQTAEALKDGAANLSCAIRIASVQVARDGMVAGNGRQGFGRDWAPIRDARKTSEIAAWTRVQEYCQG
ncbi:MAG: transglycosylase SLT domain-containing protein [Paracoccaceae bacterium]